MDVLQRDGERIGDIELVPGDDAREHQRDRDVERGTDDERPDNAPGNVALRIPRFLGGRADGIEADIRKEDDRGAHADALDAVGRERGRRQLLRLHVVKTDDQKKPDDGDLDHDHHRVHPSRFLRADDQQHRNDADDQEGGKIEHDRDRAQVGRGSDEVGIVQRRAQIGYQPARHLEAQASQQ